MRTRPTLLAIGAVAALSLTSSSAHAKETMLADFEDSGAPAPWAFSNGPEFPGATGSLTLGSGHTGSGAHLAYDFTGGGHYVAATLTLATPIDAGAIGFWVKAPAGIHATLRVVDSTGQSLQYNLARPLDAL